MSLIKCPECNNEISDKAKSCPHCGYELPEPEELFQGIYCPSCLDSTVIFDDEDENQICPFCNIKYKKSIVATFDEAYDFGENHPELKASPEFDREAYKKRINWKPGSYRSSTSIKCPTCSSTNVQRIGTGERVASVAVFGLFSKKINKSFKCNSCGYTW